MIDTDFNDDTWEEFFGTSPELMPSIMGAFDAIIGNKSTKNKDIDVESKTNPSRRSHQVNNFANLSPCVQKILSNVPEQEISKKFSSEEALGPRRFGNKVYRSMRSPEKNLNKSNENLEIISTNVQKMLSNLPDTELVISASNLSISRNSSYLYSSNRNSEFLKNALNADGIKSSNSVKQFLYHSDPNVKEDCAVNSELDKCDGENDGENEDCDPNYDQKPLGSYLHSSQGIASRTPVGRKNMGKFLQVPSESSVGNTSSTASSEVSRPVSLTSLGSCSSSESSSHHQPGSAYLASAESLDSDPEPTGSQGSADSGIAEQEQPTTSPESRVLQEVLETETVYVADLNAVIKGYLEPWRADPECPLAQHLQHLFSNLEEIYKFNRNFLEDLCKAAGESTKVAKCFCAHDSGFRVYNEYCTNYPRTMEVLGELTRDEEMAALFRERQTALGHALPLGSYLLKPVQRILKYHLLLQRLSKQCDPIHKPAVDLALTTMTGIASDINNMKRKHEHAVRVQEIQSQLYGWDGPDLTALGELIAEGTFRVVGARGRRHVFLFEKVLLLAKSKQDGALGYKSHIMCSNLMLVEQVRGEPLSFQVLPFDNPRLQATLKARSPQHKREWTLQIKRVILENYTAVIPNHARQLVMQLGQDLNQTGDTNDKWSPLKYDPTPHYLERRSRVRKTRDFSNRRASSQDRSFPSLGNWRRKSEPNMIPQYNTKTIPKKITKLKKAKECKNATFYTDLSDSETCDMVCESMESLPHNVSDMTEEHCEEPEEFVAENDTVKSNLEKIVSDILMQNQTFQKAFNRQISRKNVNSDPTSTWYEEKVKLPAKSDSLPRSFQLNDQLEPNNDEEVTDCRNERLMHDMSLKENPDTDIEEQQANDLSSQVDDTDHPEHKIYRKSAMRFSILQRIRHIVSEEQRRSQKYPIHKQGSKSMGEKIANPDYVDPQKLFLSSRNCSQIDLSDSKQTEDMMGDPEPLDLTINETEVLSEIDKRLNDSIITNEPDTGQASSDFNENFSFTSSTTTKSEASFNSSQNSSDSYYESILESSLTEEYVKDSSGKLVAKQDSFSSNESSKTILTEKYNVSAANKSPLKRPVVKRPTKAPPPIPVKPRRLTLNTNSNTLNTNSNSVCRSKSAVSSISSECNQKDLNISISSSSSSTSWVKTMVGRFE